MSTRISTLEQLKLLLNQAPCGVILYDINTSAPIFLNDGYYKIMGYSKEEYESIMMNCNEPMFCQDNFIFDESWNSFVQNGEVEEKEYRIVRKDKQVRWVKLNVSRVELIPDTYFLISILTDITKEKESMMRSALEQHRYQLVIDELNAAVLEWNFKDGSFYSSKAYENYEFSKADPMDILDNKIPMDVVHPDDIQALQQFFKESTEEKVRIETILRIKMIDGSYQWSRMIGLFYKDKNGNPDKTIRIIIDINKERERNFMLNGMLNGLPGGVGIFKFAENMECQYFSDGFAKIAGRTTQEIDQMIKNGTLLKKMIASSDYEQTINTFKDCSLKGLPINLTYRYVTASKGIGWMHLAAEKLRDENGYPVYYCIFTKPTDETALYRSIVEDSSNGIFVAERISRRVLYISDGISRIFNIPREVIRKRVENAENISKKYVFLSQDDVLSLSEDKYSEFHIVWQNKQYIKIKAKALTWNGIDSYILYFTDETAEHEHQLQLQELIDHIPGGVGIFEIYDGIAHQIYMNDSFYNILSDTRQNREERSNGNFINEVYPDDLPIIENAIDKLAKGVDKIDFVYRAASGKGEYLWLRSSIFAANRTDDKVLVYCCFTDFSESMASKEALEKSNATILQRYEQEVARRKTFEKRSALAAYFNISKQKPIELRVNDPRLKDLSSFKNDSEIQNILLSRILDTKEKENVKHFLMSNRVVERAKKGITEGAVEFRMAQDDGLLCWIRASYNLFEEPISKDLLCYIYFYDIDEEKKAQLAAESVIDDEIDYVMLLNSNTAIARFVRLSKALESPQMYDKFKFGITINNDIFELVVEEDKEIVREFFTKDMLLKKLAQKSDVSITYRYLSIDGEILRKKTRAFYLDETYQDIVITRQDITDLYAEEQQQKEILKKAADKAIQATKAKTEFLSRMSHDMRTPMNGILGIAELSIDETDPEILKKNIVRIKESGNYLLSLINDTLDFQRIESGKMKLEKQIVFAREVFNNIMGIIRPAAEAKNIHFKVNNINADLDWYVRLDCVRFMQILINLMSNAIKFTPAGGTIIFAFEYIRREGAISYNRITISDTGIGMSEEFIKNYLFHPFSQEQSEVSTQYAGSGLGLSIVHSLVEMMNGSIEVESKLGVGTTFTIYLEFERIDEDEVINIFSTKKSKQFILKEELIGKNILLVEDHSLNAEIAKKILEKAGCKVTWVDNGKKAVKSFEASKDQEYDAILMDIRMPVMGGLEAAKNIRGLYRTDAKNIPIIAMTANAYNEDVQKSIEAGMNFHLAKPIELAKLYAALAKYIGERNDFNHGNFAE